MKYDYTQRIEDVEARFRWSFWSQLFFFQFTGPVYRISCRSDHAWVMQPDGSSGDVVLEVHAPGLFSKRKIVIAEQVGTWRRIEILPDGFRAHDRRNRAMKAGSLMGLAMKLSRFPNADRAA